jgi:ketopantoate reductase
MNILIPGAGAVGVSVAAKLTGARGRRNGVDVINGAAVTKGHGQGIATPCTAMITGLIAFRESPAGGERP